MGKAEADAVGLRDEFPIRARKVTDWSEKIFCETGNLSAYRKENHLMKIAPFLFLACLVLAGTSVLAEEPSDPGLPKDYWSLPLSPQGKAPKHWPEVEAKLDPKACATCHRDKFEEWQTSLHAKALSPGLIGQLLTYSKEETQTCLNCHAPLAEQATAFEEARKKGQGHAPKAQGLAADGNACGGCHVREHKRFGPPQRDTGLAGQSDPTSPHGGVLRTRDFESSDFCAACHQFPQDQAVNGKPLENTIEEWKASPQAKQGQTCQSCHMPDRKHLWRGIHDPEMTASGLTAKAESQKDKAVFRITNSGVGHAFPTYVTPTVILHAVLLDEAGQPVPSSEVTFRINRRVDYDGSDWKEVSDTRLLPGQSAKVEIAWGNARQARVWLEVRPDDFYRTDVYAQLLKDLPRNGQPFRLISKADAAAKRNVYTLFETVIRRPYTSLH